MTWATNVMNAVLFAIPFRGLKKCWPLQKSNVSRGFYPTEKENSRMSIRNSVSKVGQSCGCFWGELLVIKAWEYFTKKIFFSAMPIYLVTLELFPRTISNWRILQGIRSNFLWRMHKRIQSLGYVLRGEAQIGTPMYSITVLLTVTDWATDARLNRPKNR